MQTLTAQYQIVTPMFIGGAHAEDNPEIRSPAIKGALRFWWRALHWGECLREEADHHVDRALRDLYQKEAALFGAAAVYKDNAVRYGQGALTIKVKDQQRLLPDTQFEPKNGHIYLLGQGLYHFKKKLLRTPLKSGQAFEITIIFNNEFEDVESIKRTLLIFGLLGNLGSRSRKGWGSVAIRSLVYKGSNQHTREEKLPENQVEYSDLIKQMIAPLSESLPPFSAFSAQTRMDISDVHRDAMALLDSVGNALQLYRSYGRDTGSGHKVNGQVAEQNFAKDHDLIVAFAKEKSPISSHPKRVVFGLPHNYFFSSLETQVDVDAWEFDSNKSSRRASPLLIHIHQFPSGQCLAVQTQLKAVFLSDQHKIMLKNAKTNIKVKCNPDWNVITDFLDRFNKKKRIL